MVIAIEIGNSNTKIYDGINAVIRLVNSEILSNSIRYVNLDINRILLSSVINKTETHKIVNKLFLQVNEIIQITSQQILENALPSQYMELSFIGCDRALRINYLCQYDTSTPVIGIGCGSAFTVEVIHNSHLIESMILLGLELQLKSLQIKSSQLPSINLCDIDTILTDKNYLSTQYAIANGIISSYTALINSLINKYNSQLLVCSGGYSELISNHVANNNCRIIQYKNLEIEELYKLSKNINDMTLI